MTEVFVERPLAMIPITLAYLLFDGRWSRVLDDTCRSVNYRTVVRVRTHDNGTVVV